MSRKVLTTPYIVWEQHLSFCHYLWCYIMAVQEATEALPFLILPQWLIPFTTKRSGILSGLR